MPDSLYDTDFYAWTREQAAKLRRLSGARSNVDLDLENLAEEVESLGNSERYAVESWLENVIEHLLKLEYSPAQYPRRGWRRDAFKARRELARHLTTALRNHLLESLAARYGNGRSAAAFSLREEDNLDPVVLPADCPYSFDQLLNEGFYPASRHGLP